MTAGTNAREQALRSPSWSNWICMFCGTRNRRRVRCVNSCDLQVRPTHLVGNKRDEERAFVQPAKKARAQEQKGPNVRRGFRHKLATWRLR